MSGFVMNILPRSALAAAAALFLAACGQQVEAPLAGAKIGGPFELTSANGQRAGDRQLAGQYRIMYFGYTHCPDVCPVDMRYISDGLAAFEKSDPDRGSKVTPVFVTVDPVRDTPAALAEWKRDLHPRLVAFTGSRPELEKVVRQFGAYGAKSGEHQMAGMHDAHEAYLVDHSRVALLMGPNGEPIAILPQEQGPKAIAAELDKYVA